MQEEAEYDDAVFQDNKLDEIMKDIKTFLRAQEKGKFKDVSNIVFNYYDINNISEIKDDIYNYYSTIQHYYNWSKYNNDDNILCRYEIYKSNLEIFLRRLNVDYYEEYSDSDIPYTDSDSDDF